MVSFSSFILLAFATKTLAWSPLFERAACNADNCLRAVTGTEPGQTQTRSNRVGDCSSFMVQTVTPDTITVTTTASFVSSTTTTILTTTTTTSTAAVANAKNKRTAVTNSPSNVPAYASPCSGVVRYSSACSCAGVTATTITVAAPTFTFTVSATSTTIVDIISISTSVAIATATSYPYPPCDPSEAFFGAQDEGGCGNSCFCNANADGVNAYCVVGPDDGVQCTSNADCPAGAQCDTGGFGSDASSGLCFDTTGCTSTYGMSTTKRGLPLMPGMAKRQLKA